MSAISVFENRVLSRIFGRKKDEVNRGVVRNFLVVLLTIYYSGDNIKNNEMEGYVSRLGDR
jgi:hypothetical protein